MKATFSFWLDFIREAFRGGKLFYLWMTLLTVVVFLGFAAYIRQFQHGLIVSGMSDQVSWGVYISNFTFLVGVAAAAVMLVIPSYIFRDEMIKEVVLLAEGLAVAACIMCILFVTVDLGRPDRIWHMLPFVGEFNFPQSLLAWDVFVLTGYLFLSLTIPYYILFVRYKGGEPKHNVYFPGVLISIGWAISIHTVTAFLLSSNVARPFWHTAILGPRFLASAFSAGPAFFLLTLKFIRRYTDYPVSEKIFQRIAIIATVALQINLFLLFAEIFTEFYHQTDHTASALYLFFGIGGKTALVPWIWSAITMNVVAVLILSIEPLRNNSRLLSVACVLMVVGVWIEKGMGLIIPGFIPTPLGEVFEYSPTLIEVTVSAGIWAVGLIIYTLLAKAAIAIELGKVRYKKLP
ncbi:MAG: polysulfide reductase NrfD [SAR324 cluster bacterium]|nr:polysulfide reductase NrfD [SAR324 cluster bacterium]